MNPELTALLDESGLIPCSSLTQRHSGNLRLSPASCAQMWLKSRRAKWWQSAYRCRGCAIGAMAAGLSNAEAYAANADAMVAGDRSCIRCGRSGRRMLGGGALCASCHARVGEAIRGVNGKHTVPRAARELQFFNGEVSQRRDFKIQKVRALVANLHEYIAVILRHQPGSEIHWPPLTVPFMEPFQRTKLRAKARAYKPVFSIHAGE